MTSQIQIDRALPVTARDGTVLTTDVYLPSAEGSYPTLIYRVRGGRSSAFIAGVLLLNPLVAVDRGYAVVIQEVRGRADSDDRWQPFTFERNDSEDCLDWVVSQPWCDGRIGTYGTAYSAVGALQMAALGRDEVRAVAVLGTGADYHNGWIYTSGAFELGWNVYWAYMTLNESIGRLDVSDKERADLKQRHSQAIIDAPDMAARLPLRDHPLLLEVGDTQFHEWLDHPDYDDYWQSVDVLASTDQMATPVLSIIGWWDNFLSSHLDLYRSMNEHSLEPGRSNHRVVIGPWEHCNYVMSLSTNKTGDVEFGTPGAAGVGVSGPLLLDWFDRWVLDKDTGPASGVRYWQLGVDEWRETPSWPPPHDDVRWYFEARDDETGGKDNEGDSRGGGLLTTTAPTGGAPDSFRYDPADPTPTVGGHTLMPTIMGAGVKDRREVAARSDVLTYTSPPLDTDVEIAGPVIVELWAESSAPDTDFTAHLVDISPDGYCAGIAEGIVRARSRESTRTRSPLLTPGEFTEFHIDLWDVAHTFLPGHRIRVEIASCNFPRFDRNLNTAAGADPTVPFGSESLDDAVVATQQIARDGKHRSCVVLPVSRPN